MARTRKLPLRSDVGPDAMTQFLLYAPPDIAEAFAAKVATLEREGHTTRGAERLAYREWTRGEL